MAEYGRYCEAAGIARKDMIEAIQDKYPRYSKVAQTMVSRPESYAVQLTPDAEDLLVARFGWHPGLAKKQRDKRCHDNKNKLNRLTLRIGDELKARLDSYLARSGFSSIQDLLEAALTEFLARHEGGCI